MSTGNIERAEAYAAERRAHELRKGWDGDKAAVNQNLVEAFDRELEHLNVELKRRRGLAATPAPTAAPLDKPTQLRLMDKQITVFEALQRCLKGG